MLIVAAALLGLCPLMVMLLLARRVNFTLRWVLVLIYGALSIYLLIFQNRPGYGPGTDPEIARHIVMFAVYFGCFIFVCFRFVGFVIFCLF